MNNALTNQTLSPRHLQLREMLFRRWKTNGVKIGEKIESQNEIIQFCGFSLITVIKTLKDLEAEGVIRRQVGKGSFLVNTPWTEAHWRIGFFYNRDIVGGGIFDNEFYTKLVVAFEKRVISDGHEFVLGSYTNNSMPISMWDALDAVILTGISSQTDLDDLKDTSGQVSLIVDLLQEAIPMHGYRLGYRQSFNEMFSHFAGQHKKYLYLNTTISSPEQAARRAAFLDAHKTHGAGTKLEIVNVNQETDLEDTTALLEAIASFKPNVICGYMHSSWKALIDANSAKRVSIFSFGLDIDQPGFVVDPGEWMKQTLPQIYGNLENRKSELVQHTFHAKFQP